jgi:hypothetical protein
VALEIERDTDRQIVGVRAAAMKGKESAVVPDPRFVLDAASSLYYHARDACKESAQGFCICFLSLSLSLSNSSPLHDTEVPEVFLGGEAGRRIRVFDGLIHPHPFANASDLNLGLVVKLFFVWIFFSFFSP